MSDGSNIIPFPPSQKQVAQRVHTALVSYFESLAKPEAHRDKQYLLALLQTIGLSVGDDVDTSGCRLHLHNRLKVHFNVHSIDEIPEEQLPAAIALLEKIREDAREFSIMMYELNFAFRREVVGGGEPWIPWIKRSLGRDVSSRPDWRALAREVARERRTQGSCGT